LLPGPPGSKGKIPDGSIDMPIYEYRCEACGHYLETLQKISDPPLTDCHKCGQPALKKLVSASAFRLKGGGWYETDFKTGGKKNVVEPDKKDSKNSKDSGKDSAAGKPKGGDTPAGTAAKKETAGS
jgi:putative FmdB family regulatory protein